MYRIIKDGASIGLTENLNFIKQAENGCFILCPEPNASGIVFEGTAYHLLGREALAECETVCLEVVDGGKELQYTNAVVHSSAKLSGQMEVATKLFIQSTTIEDDLALQMPSLFKTWEEVLKDSVQLKVETILNLDGQLYRVLQPVIPQTHQRPDGEGMTAIYRPIDTTHQGTIDDPIPFVYGMDVTAGLYYSCLGKIYLCNQTIPGCVYAPDTPGLWQWEEVTDAV